MSALEWNGYTRLSLFSEHMPHTAMPSTFNTIIRNVLSFDGMLVNRRAVNVTRQANPVEAA
jgi:hypothetical protein